VHCFGHCLAWNEDSLGNTGCFPGAHQCTAEDTPHNRPSDVIYTIQCLSSCGTTRPDPHRHRQGQEDNFREEQRTADLAKVALEERVTMAGPAYPTLSNLYVKDALVTGYCQFAA